MTRKAWEPEVAITVDVAARAIAEQFPQLAHLPVRAFDAGWDNVVVTVGQDIVFRFVHRAVALDGSRRELVVLRDLADGLPAPVPEPRYVGEPTPEVPWPFWGGPLLRGAPLATGTLPAPDEVGAQLGAFLRALHSPDRAARATATGALPTDPLGRGGPRTVARAREGLSRLRAAGLLDGPVGPGPDDVARLEGLFAEAEQLAEPDVARGAAGAGRLAEAEVARAAAGVEPGPGVGSDSVVLVHGDLHVRHVLTLPDGDGGARLTGVLDWGDTCLADPSVDLMIAWAAFDGSGRAAFLESYGQVPRHREVRARVLAARVGAALAEQAASDGQRALTAVALGTIARAAR